MSVLVYSRWRRRQNNITFVTVSCTKVSLCLPHLGWELEVVVFKLARLNFFWGGYLPSLRINHVAMNKRYRKNLPLLYYIKMKICYGLCFILTSEIQWQRNEAIRLIICLRISRYQEFSFSENGKGSFNSLYCLYHGKVWTNFMRAFWKYFGLKFKGS